MNQKTKEHSSKTSAVSMTRREFCHKAIKRSSIAGAVGVAGYLAYRKPEIRSFFGTREAYANGTPANGKFSLNGDSN